MATVAGGGSSQRTVWLWQASCSASPHGDPAAAAQPWRRSSRTVSDGAATVTDEAPPRQLGNGKRPPPEADPDPGPSPPPRRGRRREAPRVSTAPEPRPIKATISPNETQRPGPSAPRTDSQA